MFEDLNDDTIEDILNTPEPTLDRDTTDVIYLDQKIWGQLHDGKHNPDSRHSEAYDVVKQSVDDATAIYPFSIAHFIETDAHPDKAFRRDLYELMFDLSNNFSIANYFTAREFEIVSYLMDIEDYLPEIDPAHQVIGRGLIFPHGKYQIHLDDTPLPHETQQEIDKVLRSEYVTCQAIQSDDFLSQATKETKEQRAAYTKTLEAIRQDALNLTDSDEERWQILLARSFINEIIPQLFQAATELGLDIRQPLLHDAATHRLDGLVAHFPTYYCHLNLALGRDFHWDRKIEANDLEDIMALAVAIPYTDVVVTEQFFGGVAYKHDLHTKYDTTILTDSSDLEAYITG